MILEGDKFRDWFAAGLSRLARFVPDPLVPGAFGATARAELVLRRYEGGFGYTAAQPAMSEHAGWTDVEAGCSDVIQSSNPEAVVDFTEQAA